MFSSTDNGVYRYHIGDFEQEKPKFSTIRTNIHQKRITYTFYQNDILSFVDEEHDLFLFDVTRNTKVYIRNVKELIGKYGRIRGIISFHDDIIIAFVQNGLVKLAAASRYSESVINSNIRIFSVYKGPIQDIIWVGTDGQGVLLYSRQKNLATHLMFGQLQNKLVRQVRSIHTDSRGDLWFGTKGDGLIRVEHYAQDAKEKLSDKRILVYFPEVKKNLQEYRRGLTEYQVFGIVPSRYTDGFWIGSADNPGLSYYDYKTDRVIPVKEQSGLLQRVHRIYEANDSTLWLTTSGHGVCKVLFKNRNGQITADSIRQFVFRDGQREINDFFPMLVENDSIMWLGSRGMGMVRFNFREETYKVLLPGGKERLALNDILSIHKKDETFYLGTVSGLVSLKYGPDGMHGIQSIGKEQGFLSDMNHGIYNYEGKNLWATLRVENDTLLTGYRITNGWARTNYTYFAISLSQPIKEYGYQDRQHIPYNGWWRKFPVNRNFPEMAGRKIAAYFEFDTTRHPELVVKVALSATSTEGDLWQDYFIGNILFEDQAPESEGSRIYHSLIPDAEAYIGKRARTVLSTLYFSPEDSIVPVYNLHYTLQDIEGISAKDGGNGEVSIFYSTRHIAKSFANQDTAKVDFETRGVLLHELTHAYQLEPQGIGNYGNSKVFWAFIEGMADAVRIANGGFHGEADRPKGGSYMDGYRKAGYFFVWLRDHKDPDGR